MARYTGPKSKIARKFREPIFGPDKALEKKNYPPGQHGNTKKRAKQSEYAVQLMEKQKAKYTYGILEKQFARTFDRAARSHGITGEVLLQLIESRLDNVVYRMGIAPSRRGARQLVSHAHITVIANSVAGTVNKHAWLDFDRHSLSGKFISRPERSQIPENIKEQLIVELYSK